ncbi:MAG: hypothetical protein KBT48_08570 [Firmicutes bacterium]|nr:hypothetical protein [Bacillota bacterium]
MRKILKKIGISLLVIVTVFILGVFGFSYAENNGLFYDKFNIVFDNQTKEEKIDVQTYFEDKPMTGTRITPDQTEIRVVNDKYTNLDNVDISTFGLKVRVYDDSIKDFVGESDMLYIPAEYGETYHVTITGDRENGLTLDLNE